MSLSLAGLLELAGAHRRSRVLAALVALDVPALLDPPASSERVAEQLRADPAAVRLLLDAAVLLGVLERTPAGYGNTPAATRFLRRDGPEFLGGLFLRDHRLASSPAWAEFPERLLAWRSGAARFDACSAPADAERESQHRLALLAGEALDVAFDVSAHRRLLDLGGGTGAMSIALCGHHPGLEAVIVEHPSVAEQARAHVREARLAARIEVRAGDFLDASPWPAGADLVLLANVLSMLPAATSQAVFARTAAYLPPGGAVVVSGWMPSPTAGGPLEPLLFGLEDIALGAPDVERPAAEYAAWLDAAGFTGITIARYFPPLTLVSGRRPSGAGATS